MIVVSQDRMSVCNTFDFTISDKGFCGKHTIVNRLDGLTYGSYTLSTCKKIIRDIFEDFARFPNGVYQFPEYDD